MDRIHKLRRKAAEAAVEAYPFLSWCATNLSCPSGPVSRFVEIALRMKQLRDAGQDGWDYNFNGQFVRYRHGIPPKRFRDAKIAAKDIPKAVAMEVAGHIEKWASEVVDQGGRIPSVPPVLGGGKETSGEDVKDETPVTWQGIQGQLLHLCEQNQAYTSYDKLAKRLKCSSSTIHKAINESARLRDWAGLNDKKAPKVQSLNKVVTDRTVGKVGDPAEIVAENEQLDNEFARLIQDAKPEDRAKLHSLDLNGQRELAREILTHREDRTVQESGPERTNPAYSNPKRRGNRLLGRKP
jgi:hypothetical protein